MTEIIKKYIDMRNEKMLNPMWFIEYALEKTGVRHQYKDIHTYLQFANHEDIFNKLDKEFNLDTLHDNHGRFLMCYPGSN